MLTILSNKVGPRYEDIQSTKVGNLFISVLSMWEVEGTFKIVKKSVKFVPFLSL